MLRFTPLLFSLLLFVCQPLAAQSIHSPAVDLDVVEKIKSEGLDNSQVMNFASWLTDVYGPRLTNSPQMTMRGNTPNRNLKRLDW